MITKWTGMRQFFTDHLDTESELDNHVKNLLAE